MVVAGDRDIDEGVADGDDTERHQVSEDKQQHHIDATPGLLRQVVKGTTADGE